MTVIDRKEGCRFALEFVSEREDRRVCVLHGCESASQLWSAHAHCSRESGGSPFAEHDLCAALYTRAQGSLGEAPGRRKRRLTQSPTLHLTDGPSKSAGGERAAGGQLPSSLDTTVTISHSDLVPAARWRAQLSSAAERRRRGHRTSRVAGRGLEGRLTEHLCQTASACPRRVPRVSDPSPDGGGARRRNNQIDSREAKRAQGRSKLDSRVGCSNDESFGRMTGLGLSVSVRVARSLS